MLPHNRNKYSFKKICYLSIAALMAAALVSSLLPAKTVLADSKGKVYVCKYVGQPGVDESLQTGQNPVEVSVNTIPQPVVIGSYFPDKQGRSYVLGFVPMDPEPTREDCPPPNAPGNASVSVTTGVCSWTQAGGSLTPVTLELVHASLTINGITYTTSQTINLPPGSYPYTWTAETGYVGSGSGTVVVGDCTPGTASASVTTGECIWTQAGGSLTPVTIEVNHASLTIHGVTYFTSQTINLSPGSYPYTWTAVPGYIGNGSGTVVIGDCTPGEASVFISTGTCSWTQAGGSLTPVYIEVNHATLTINGKTYSSSQTINLPPGSYAYSWTATSGFIGSGSGTIVIGDCTPGTARASVTIGSCSWTEATGSMTPMTLDLEHASLTINGTTFINSQTINLPPGNYPYSWTAVSGYIGNGSGEVIVGDCTPGTASASVTAGICGWSEAEGSLTPVSIEVDHAMLTINSVNYVAPQTINLPPGSYPYSWTADTGYIGEGSGTVEIGDCTPGSASASVSAGTCSWTQAGGSLTPVSIEVNHASLTIDGTTYTTSQIINLPPGSYLYTWTSEPGFIGSGSGTVVVGDCTPGLASASVTAGTCSWSQAGGSLTPVTLDLVHASLTINGTTYNTSQIISLPPGTYPFNWTAESGFIGNGSGTVVIGDCTPGTANASVSAGACNWTQAGGSLTPVSIELNHASLIINGITYTTSQSMDLPPGNYPYTWTAENGYIGNGSGTVVIGDCTPGTASVSVTTGLCIWTQAAGSLTSVSIELNHASLIINGVTYTTSQTIDLPPGNYPYTWTAENGFIGNGSGAVDIGDCTPGTASASVTAGACNWTQAGGSLTPVSIELNHSLLMINGITYTTSQTLDLPPGNYPYTWTAESGFIGNGSGTVVIGDCTPGTASASVTAGACHWTESGGSLTPVILELEHASLIINGTTYNNSQTIQLPPGSYPYSWTAVTGYIGNGGGTVVIGDCKPGSASASVTPGKCKWTQAAGSLTSVSIEVNHASLTINGVTYTSSQTIKLPPGSYPYSWTAVDGYTGSGSGTIGIGSCPPPNPPKIARASVTTGICSWSQVEGSLTAVNLEMEHASLTINSVTYTASQTIFLPPGSYSYSWAGVSGYSGNGSGAVMLRDCPPILIPISGVDKGLLDHNLPNFFFGPWLDNNALTRINLSSYSLNTIPSFGQKSISTERHLQASPRGFQSTGLIPNRLVIPSINVDAPVVPVGYQETVDGGQVHNQWLTPVQFAAGWHVTSALLGDPGNTVLNGHHNAYGMVFKDLVKMQIGDVISVFSGSQEFRYEVISNTLFPENFISLSLRIENARWIEPSLDERVTLVTCWPENSNTHRVVIVARPMSNPDQAPSP